MKKFVVIVFFFILAFIVAGFFFAGEIARRVAEIIWLGMLLTLLGFLIIGLIWIWNKAKREALIYPDENGNLPIRINRNGVHDNFNLTGADNFRAWGAWQITNNKTGSQPRELVKHMVDSAQTQPISIPAEIISDDDAPPILIEARNIAQEL